MNNRKLVVVEEKGDEIGNNEWLKNMI
jgi:hypothetical protein